MSNQSKNPSPEGAKTEPDFWEDHGDATLWKLPKVPHRLDALSTTRFVEAIRMLQGERGDLLEVGCGTGYQMGLLAEQFQRLVGLDLSAQALELGRRSCEAELTPEVAARVSFVKGSAEEVYPFEDASFDVVVCLAILEHLVDVFAAVDEMARVCKPGGVVLVMVPNIAYVKHVWNLVQGKVPLTGAGTRDIGHFRKHGWDGGHLHYFTRASLTALLRDAGFEPEEWSSSGKWARIRRRIPNLTGGLLVRARRV